MNLTFHIKHLPKLTKFWQRSITTGVGAIAISVCLVAPAPAQLSDQAEKFLNPSSDGETPELLNLNSTSSVKLDGRNLFKIAEDSKVTASERTKEIEQNLKEFSRVYFEQEFGAEELEILTKPASEPTNPEDQPIKIVASVGGEEQEIMTVKKPDAELEENTTIEERAAQIAAELEESLKQAKQERQSEFLTRQGIIAGCTAAGMIAASVTILYYGRSYKRRKEDLSPSKSFGPFQIPTKLNQEQLWNVKEVQHRILQLSQVVVWGGGTIFILSLFPYTRPVQAVIIRLLRIPIRIGIVGIITYFLIRLGYALINRFTSVLAQNYLQDQHSSRRLQLRISTVSGITKSVLTISLAGIAFLVALTFIGVDIAPILAGAGIIGLAVSLASQNLIKDALNGFFIILEDQYAVGDVITVGDVGGLVENINLRITQLRDAEGRLITVPNSEIKVVANLSSNWSRADLNIPVAYQTDVDKALEVVNEVSATMSQEPEWQEMILEPPSVLGVDNFVDRGLIIRVWIKTQPLKQWDVAREFRRRIKIAFEKADMPIPLPQQQLWVQELSSPLKLVKEPNNNHQQ